MAKLTSRKRSTAAPKTTEAAVEVHHAPKPFHGWREFFKEYGIIVLGVLTALSAEQLVEAVRWQKKVAASESAIRAELSNDLGLATEQKLLHGCVLSYLDTLQAAVIRDDPTTIRKLHDMKPPLIGRAWPRDTWTAALNGQVSDHLSEARVTAYSRAFLRIEVQREFMQQMEDEYPAALSGGLGLSRDLGAANQQLVAIERLKSLEGRRLMISNSLLEEDGPQLSVEPSRTYSADDRALAQSCDANLRTIQAARK